MLSRRSKCGTLTSWSKGRCTAQGNHYPPTDRQAGVQMNRRTVGPWMGTKGPTHHGTPHVDRIKRHPSLHTTTFNLYKSFITHHKYHAPPQINTVFMYPPHPMLPIIPILVADPMSPCCVPVCVWMVQIRFGSCLSFTPHIPSYVLNDRCNVYYVVYLRLQQ